MLVYSGNNDIVCPVSSTRYWIKNQLTESDTGNSVTKWTPWHVADDVGGWYESWDRFAYVVVRDAGHEVPEYQPVRAYSLFQRFLNWNYDDTPIAIEHADWMGIDGVDPSNGGGSSSQSITITNYNGVSTWWYAVVVFPPDGVTVNGKSVECRCHVHLPHILVFY